MKSAGQSLPDSMLQNFSTNQRMERIGLCHINRAAQSALEWANAKSTLLRRGQGDPPAARPPLRQLDAWLAAHG